MVRLGLLYIWFYCVLLRNSSDANKLIVGRAEAKTGNIKLDFFIYTDGSSCANYVNDVTPWCKERNAYSLSSLPVISSRYKCSCQCQWNMVTFLLDERRCVNESYLMSRFGSGTFLLDPAIDLTIDSHLDTNKNCWNCQVTKVEYHQANNVWKKIEIKNLWDINNDGRLDWKKSTVDEVNGKIIRIQICQQSGQGCVYETVFCKSKGNSSLTITDVAPTPTASAVISSTVIPTPTSTASVVPISSALPSSAIHTSKMSTQWSQVSVPATYTSQPPWPNERGGNSDEAGSPIGAIVGAVIACIVVIVMIIVIFIIWKRRKQSSRSNSSKTVAINSTGNATQNQGEIISLPQRQDNDDNNTGNEEYEYAAVDGVPSVHQKTSKPLYESLNKDNVQDSVYAHLSKKQSKETPVEYSFNHLQHPQYNSACSKSDPLYNNLGIQNKDHHLEHETHDDPKAAEGSHPDTTYQPLGMRVQGQESVYAHLSKEATNSSPTEYSYNHVQQPEYNPARSKKDPLYNTLKRPNDDEHLEHETQNNHNPKAAKGPEGAHPDQTYQSLGVRVQDDLYQPLDRVSQSNDQSLYQNAL